VSFERWVRHVLKLGTTAGAGKVWRQPAADVTFVFSAYDRLQRHDVLRSASLAVNKDVLSMVTANDLDAMCHALQAGHKGALDLNPAVRSLLNDVQVRGASVRGSPYARRQLRTTALALVGEFNAPGLFVTINLFDNRDYRLHLAFHSGRPPGPDAGPSTTPGTWPNSTERLFNYTSQALRVAGDPVTVARWFNDVMSSVLEHLVGDGRTGKRGVFGTCCAHFGTVECQGRGSLHGHFELFIAEMSINQIEQQCNDALFVSSMSAFLDSIVSECLDVDALVSDIVNAGYTSTVCNK
jgi:hypothetical protein